MVLKNIIEDNDIILTEGAATGDLMILIRSRENSCYPDIEYVVSEGLTINLIKQTWTFDRQTFHIGRHRYIAPMDKRSVIGVYDNTNKKHRVSMIWDYGELIKSPYVEID